MQACMYVLCRRRQAELLIPPLRVTTCLDVCVDGEPIRDTMSGSLGALSKEDGFVISGMPSSLVRHTDCRFPSLFICLG